MPSHESTVSEPRETAKHRTVRRIAVKRGFGYVFDAWFFAIVILPVQWGINQVLTDNTARYWITAAAASILFFLYRFLMDAHAGGTLGKAVVGLRVTTETGGHLGYTRALKRNFYWLIFGPALVPGSNHPQLHIGTVGGYIRKHFFGYGLLHWRCLFTAIETADHFLIAGQALVLTSTKRLTTRALYVHTLHAHGA